MLRCADFRLARELATFFILHLTPVFERRVAATISSFIATHMTTRRLADEGRQRAQAGWNIAPVGKALLDADAAVEH